MIVSLGMALVIGTEGVDLSVGSIMALASRAASRSTSGYGALARDRSSRWSAAPLVGAFNGSLVAFVGVQPIVATLGAAGRRPRARAGHRRRRSSRTCATRRSLDLGSATCSACPYRRADRSPHRSR